MNPSSLTLPIAFLAGLLSFASPCVLPLVPAYLGYLGGMAVASGRQEAKPGTVFFHALLFVLGFAMVFVVLGASATFLGRLLLSYSLLLRRVGGVLLILFGMRLLGVQRNRRWWIAIGLVAGLLTFVLDKNDPVRRVEESALVVAVVLAAGSFAKPILVGLAAAAGVLNFLSSFDDPMPNAIASLLIATIVYIASQSDFFYSEKRLELKSGGQAGYLRSLLVGLIFAAGWTPCIGPILTGILVLASTLETVGQGMLLLAFYSLGLGIPFLLAGLAFGPLSRVLRRGSRHLGAVSLVSGALLALMGILIFTDSLTFLAQYGSFINVEL